MDKTPPPHPPLFEEMFLPLFKQLSDLKRGHGRVIRAARLRAESRGKREFEAGLRHATTGKFSLSTQQ